MSIVEVQPDLVPGAKIMVMWIWWWWCNSGDRMIEEWLEWVEFIWINSDAQALSNSLAPTKINIWLNLTKWLWAWADPETWRKAAEENVEDLKKVLDGTDMLFITCWLGGGTGTWAIPVVAWIAKEMWILTVAVVTKPFSFEWKKRFENAQAWMEKLKWVVDTLIVIPNDKIFNIIDKKTTFKQAFNLVDKILHLWVQGISDLIIKPGDINIDFADIKVIMAESGTALLGIGYGEWENRTVEATRKAIENPLLEIKLEWAKNIIFAVTWWDDLTPMEVQEAADIIEEIADDDANIIWWMTSDESFEWEVKVTIIATWFPEIVQDHITKWRSPTSRLWWLNTPLKWSTRSSDFVSKTLKKPQKTANSNIEKSSNIVDEDTEVPAFLRKKVKK